MFCKVLRDFRFIRILGIEIDADHIDDVIERIERLLKV